VLRLASGLRPTSFTWRLCAFALNSFPIPAAPPEKPKAVERLVARLLAAKQRDAEADTSALEREIASQPRRMFPQILTVAGATSGDQLVYALYGLTPEEIQIVEGAAK
jgi:hypothetical protein